MKKNRIFLILVAVCTVSVVLLPGCDLFAYKRPFPDAYYTSNFIEGIGFGEFEGENAVVPSPPVTGKWDFAYRYLDWVGAYPYMTRTLVGPASSYPPVPSGLSATAEVYRLELVNLISGGDFETSVGGVWLGGGSGSYGRINNLSMFEAYYMSLNAPVSADTVTYTPDLTGAPNLSQPFIAYFRYTSTEDFYTQINSGPNQNLSYGTKHLVKRSFSGNGNTPFFTFLPITFKTFSDLKVDNFRLTRSGNMELRLLLSPTETNPALETGVYSFSVWVYTDPLAYSTKSPYQMDTFQLTLRNTINSKLSAEPATYIPSIGWQKIQAILSTKALQFTTGTEPVLELVLSCNDSRPGRVLLAQPELRFYPDYPSGL